MRNRVSCTHLAKFVINHGILDVKTINWLVYDLVKQKSSEIHRKLKQSNLSRLSPAERLLRTDAGNMKYLVRRAKKRKYDQSHIESLERQCESKLALYDASKRSFVDLASVAESSFAAASSCPL